MHPRNRHQGHYDFPKLILICPELVPFVLASPIGEPSIDFADARAVRLLNRALLCAQYGVQHWQLPDGYLCPPIPGRADYLAGLADILTEAKPNLAAATACVLDVGVGASCIYPLLGHAQYGWQFVGSDIDQQALAAAQHNIDANQLQNAIELRHQPQRGQIFTGVIQVQDRFALSICNPPFHASAAEAARGSARKWRNLAQSDDVIADRVSPNLNFGGKGSELWCTGGEASFIKRMINESAKFGAQVRWFSSLVAKAEHLPDIYKQLKKHAAKDVRTVVMAQGNKQSRFVAWTFSGSR